MLEAYRVHVADRVLVQHDGFTDEELDFIN
jgi:hypothetical protein